MPSNQGRRTFSDIRVKTAAECKKSDRKNSLRKLENFTEVLQQFQKLSMSDKTEVGNRGAPNNSIQQPTLPTGPDEIKAELNKLIDDRAKPLRILNLFAKKGPVSRQMLTAVQNKVALYNEVKDLDIRLDYLHSEFLDCCGQTPEQLNEANDPLSPNKIEEKFTESGDILDRVEETFRAIKNAHPDKQVVIDHLEFLDKTENLNKTGADSIGSQESNPLSCAVGRGEEYIKGKLPKFRTDMDSKFETLKEKFESADNLTEHQLNQILKQLEHLETKIADDSPFEKLLQDAYNVPTFDRAEITVYEDWQVTIKALVESLIEKFRIGIEAKCK